MLQLMATEGTKSVDVSTVTSIASTFSGIISSIAGIAGSGWLGMLSVGFVALLLTGGSALLFGMLAKYLTNKIYTGDINASNSSAGKEAVEAGQADNAAKKDADAALESLHTELDKLENPK